MLNIKQFVFNPFDENTYLAIDSDTREAIVIDPGMSNAQELDKFYQYVSENELTIKK